MQASANLSRKRVSSNLKTLLLTVISLLIILNLNVNAYDDHSHS